MTKPTKVTAPKKAQSLIQLEEGMQLAPRLSEPGVAMQMVATYHASHLTLMKARTDMTVMSDLMEKAAEMPATEAAEVISDFLSQVAVYGRSILGSLNLPKPPMTVTTKKDQVAST